MTDLDRMEREALRRLREWINRSAGQHARAISKQFKRARREARLPTRPR